MSYASVQAIREGAGLLFRDQATRATGAVDGGNKVFVVPRHPLVDSNYDDQVDADDVTAYVNGAPVGVAAVDPVTGSITLKAAPVANASVTFDYSFSPVTDDYIEGKQEESDSWVDLKIKAYASVPLNPVPGIIATAAELYASGLILTRDWGSRADTEMTSKDGFAKIKMARDLIADYIQGLKDDNATTKDTNGSNSSVSAVSDADIFDRVYSEDTIPRGGTTDDDQFMRRQ